MINELAGMKKTVQAIFKLQESEVNKEHKIECQRVDIKFGEKVLNSSPVEYVSRSAKWC